MIFEVLFLLVFIWFIWLYIRYWHNAGNSQYLRPYCKVLIDKPRCDTCLQTGKGSPTRNLPLGSHELDNAGNGSVGQIETLSPAVENSKPKNANVSATHTAPLFESSGPPDDLKQIKGIGKVMEKTLNSLGVTTFAQLANFEQADIDKVTDALDGFSGRIERDQWIEQARTLAR